MRGLIVGGIALLLLLGCNNGLAEELAVEKRLGEIGRSAENVFYSFMGLIADTLGFTVKADTTKQQVGEYFSKLGVKVGEASAELEKVAGKAAEDGDKDGLLSKTIREAVEAAKTTLNKLKDHLESLKDIGDAQVVGDTVTSGGSSTQGTAAGGDGLNKILKALQGIVETAKKEGIPEPEVGEKQQYR